MMSRLDFKCAAECKKVMLFLMFFRAGTNYLWSNLVEFCVTWPSLFWHSINLFILYQSFMRKFFFFYFILWLLYLMFASKKQIAFAWKVITFLMIITFRFPTSQNKLFYKKSRALIFDFNVLILEIQSII